MNSIPFRQRLWEIFPPKNEGKLSGKLCLKLCMNSSSFQQSLLENHVGSSQLGHPIINILSWGPVAQPVATQQWGEQGGRRRKFPLVYVGSQAEGDNRKRASSAQRREGPKAQLTAVQNSKLFFM
jgi:hypothetical protein